MTHSRSSDTNNEAHEPSAPDAMPAWEAHHGCRGDFIDRYRARIEERAFALSQARQAGSMGAGADWSQAECEVIRSVLTGIDAVGVSNHEGDGHQQNRVSP